ncbi:nuclear transport factor 2 family protein [Candidatus Bathyarchaeota archaeon]|nr:nuclear transport factor 2 family protein [Candidatus Bathyarchaeota archaeon]
MIRPDGSVFGKAEALRDYQPRVRYWELAESDDYRIRVYGDTAVVIGRWTARGVNRGERFDYQARYTSVWVREGGFWRMVSDQSTEISA